MKVLVILGYPRSPSLCAALAQAYADGARAAGVEVELIDLGALRFDPDVHPASPLQQLLEPDLALAWEKIDRGDLLLVVALTYLPWFVVIPLYHLA